ncbi:MAG: hypothetical protein NC223_03615 [Butyrivibrio sp.]|nr:hypothetical protein [Butyrivibrio sp.]
MSKSKLRGLIVIIAVSAAVLAVLIVMKVRRVSEDKLVLSGYVFVTFDGFDGRATAAAVLDDMGIYSALAGSGAGEEERLKYEEFVKSVTYRLDKTEGLKNGDELTVEVDCDESIAQRLKIKIDKTPRTAEVSGLETGTELDVFAELKIITGGISPYIYVTYSNESDNKYLSALQYEISRTSGLAIGDEITIRCNIDKKAAAAQGYFFENNEMTYTIDRADKYIDSTSELDMELLDDIVKENIRVIGEEVADTTKHMSYEVTGDMNYLFRDGNEEARDFRLHKAVLACNASGYEQDHENYVLFFYNGKVAMPLYNNTEDPYEYLDAWMCFIYSDAVLSMDGETAMATNAPELRYVCGSSYDDVLLSVVDEIGRAYDFKDIENK